MADLDRLDVYKELCNSYRAIDEFRTKLLGFLPLVTAGAAVALLPNNIQLSGDKPKIFELVAIFGVFTAVGLYAYELYGITKCTYLINLGKHLESEAGIYGQFRTRPARVINEPFAAAVIYPAVMAAWMFIAIYPLGWESALIVALVVFVAGFWITIRYTRRLPAEWSKDHPQLKERQQE